MIEQSPCFTFRKWMMGIVSRALARWCFRQFRIRQEQPIRVLAEEFEVAVQHHDSEKRSDERRAALRWQNSAPGANRKRDRDQQEDQRHVSSEAIQVSKLVELRLHLVVLRHHAEGVLE